MIRRWQVDGGAWLQLGLLLVALQSVAHGVTLAGPRGPDLPLITSFVLLAALAGSLMAQLRVRPRAAATWLLLGGATLVAVRVGVLGGVLAAFFGALLRLAAWPGVAAMSLYPDVSAPLTTTWAALLQNLGVFVARVLEWVVALFSPQGAYFDPVAAAAVWSLGLWSVAAWSGFVLGRYRRPLLALFPPTALLGVLFSYTGRSPTIFLPILAAGLLLLALTAHRGREFDWTAMGLDFSRDIRADLTAATLLLATALVLLAALVPALSLRDLADFARRITERQAYRGEQVAESLGVEQQPIAGSGAPSTFALLGTTTLPQQHLIGSGPELSRRVALIVRTGELPPQPEETLTQTPPRHYWRSIVYSYYTGAGWFAGGAQINTYRAGEAAPLPQLPTQGRVRQEVQAVSDTSGLLYVTGQLAAVDQPYALAWFPPGEIFAGTIAVQSYRADSLQATATAEQLRRASSRYPDWILDRYLELPDSVTMRVKSLARDLTASAPTPYDRAVAIEQYLRDFPYTLDVPTPPRDQDIADYFLFDLREGYCDYYATTMVVLARAAGLPARMVVGYAPGTYDAPNARYILTEADAHAWVEIYFSEYGWIEFEPTAALPPIEHTATELAPEWPDGDPLLPPEAVVAPSVNLWPWLYRPALALGILLALWLLVDELTLRLLLPATAISHLYRRVRQYAPRLAVTLAPGATPYEVAAAYAQRWETLGLRGGWLARALLPTPALLEQLMTCYVYAWYTPTSPDTITRAQAIALWRGLRWRLWLAWLWRHRRRVQLSRVGRMPRSTAQRPTEPPIKPPPQLAG